MYSIRHMSCPFHIQDSRALIEDGHRVPSKII